MCPRRTCFLCLFFPALPHTQCVKPGQNAPILARSHEKESEGYLGAVLSAVRRATTGNRVQHPRLLEASRLCNRDRDLAYPHSVEGTHVYVQSVCFGQKGGGLFLGANHGWCSSCGQQYVGGDVHGNWCLQTLHERVFAAELA